MRVCKLTGPLTSGPDGVGGRGAPLPSSMATNFSGVSLAKNVGTETPGGGQYERLHSRVTWMVPLGWPLGAVSSNVPADGAAGRGVGSCRLQHSEPVLTLRRVTSEIQPPKPESQQQLEGIIAAEPQMSQ